MFSLFGCPKMSVNFKFHCLSANGLYYCLNNGDKFIETPVTNHLSCVACMSNDFGDPIILIALICIYGGSSIGSGNKTQQPFFLKLCVMLTITLILGQRGYIKVNTRCSLRSKMDVIVNLT